MNKSAIALAIAAALATSTVAMAETTLYGSARGSVVWTDPDSSGPDDDDDDFWDVRNHSSRLGVRGSEDLGNGLSAIYQYEFGVDLTEGGNFNSNRPRVLGLRGGFGQVSLGTQWTPYYNVAGRIDVFNASFFNLTKQIFRRDNTLVYNTPSIAGFVGESQIQMDGNGREEDIDEYSLGFNYSNGPFGVGAAYISNEFNDSDAFVVSAGFRTGAFSIAALYEDGDYTTDNDFLVLGVDPPDLSTGALVASYTFGNNILRAGIAARDNDDITDEIDDDDRDLVDIFDDDQIEYAIGLQHNLSLRSRVWVEFQDVEDDFSAVSVGMRHDF